MKSAARWLCAAALVFFAGSVVYAARELVFRPVARCQPAMIDLGSVVAGDPVDVNFRIINAGWWPLSVESVAPTCGSCLRVRRFTPQRVGAGDAVDVQLELLTERMRGGVVRNVVITSNDPVQPRLLLPVRAFVGAAVEAGKDAPVRRD